MMSDPTKPTREQARAEKRLRDMGVTVTMQPHGLHPHVKPEPGCFTCAMLASMERVNGTDDGPTT